MVKILDKLDVEDHPVGMAYKITCEGYVLHVGESVKLSQLLGTQIDHLFRDFAHLLHSLDCW